MGTVAWIAISFPLRYLATAERLRSPAPSAITTYIAQYGPWIVALFVPALEISLIIGAHNYLPPRAHGGRDHRGVGRRAARRAAADR